VAQFHGAPHHLRGQRIRHGGATRYRGGREEDGALMSFQKLRFHGFDGEFVACRRLRGDNYYAVIDPNYDHPKKIRRQYRFDDISVFIDDIKLENVTGIEFEHDDMANAFSCALSLIFSTNEDAKKVLAK
jgi:hypothetical protein